MKLTDVLDIMNGTDFVTVVLYGKDERGIVRAKKTIYVGKIDAMPRWVWKDKIIKKVIAYDTNHFLISVVEVE